MIRYNCWMCCISMESPEATIGQTQHCPKCDTPNEVPKLLEPHLDNDVTTCHFCNQVGADGASACFVNVGTTIFNPMVRCICGHVWQWTLLLGENAILPSCPSCSSNKIVPDHLPPIPVGDSYRDFSATFKADSSSGPRIRLDGYVFVPRCKKCYRIHKIVFRISIVTGILVMAALSVMIVLGPKRALRELLTLGIISWVVGALIIYLTKFVLEILLGRKRSREETAKHYSTVKNLTNHKFTAGITGAEMSWFAGNVEDPPKFARDKMV